MLTRIRNLLLVSVSITLPFTAQAAELSTRFALNLDVSEKIDAALAEILE